jgi:hypothetical protein
MQEKVFDEVDLGTGFDQLFVEKFLPLALLKIFTLQLLILVEYVIALSSQIGNTLLEVVSLIGYLDQFVFMFSKDIDLLSDLSLGFTQLFVQKLLPLALLNIVTLQLLMLFEYVITLSSEIGYVLVEVVVLSGYLGEFDLMFRETFNLLGGFSL